MNRATIQSGIPHHRPAWRRAQNRRAARLFWRNGLQQRTHHGYAAVIAFQREPYRVVAEQHGGEGEICQYDVESVEVDRLHLSEFDQAVQRRAPTRFTLPEKMFPDKKVAVSSSMLALPTAMVRMLCIVSSIEAGQR